MDEEKFLNKISVHDKGQLKPEIELVEPAQLIAIISKKEYKSYAIKINEKKYLMLIDNKITYDLIELNPYIVVIEDNEQKDIELIYQNGGFLQKKFNNIIVTFIRYSGNLNQKNIIKYDENYFKNLNNKNPLLKKYQRHIKDFGKDFGIKLLFELDSNNSIRGGFQGCESACSSVGSSDRRRIYTILIICIVICVILTILGIIFPSFGKYFFAFFENN